MNKKFKNLRIMDNFYQSSSFFPMPLCLVGTLDENQEGTSFGAYSLCFPYYVAGKDFYAMILETRNSSNTAKGLLRHGKCTLNFIPFTKKNFEQHVLMGFPGDTPEEKMKALTRFTPAEGLRALNDPNNKYPKIIDEAVQVFECTWVKELDNAQDDEVLEEYEGPYHNFNGITSKFGAHFILKIENILLKEKYYDAIVNGVNSKNFCPLPTNWGYRDSKNFWCSDYKKPIAVGIPNREVDLSSIKYALERIDTDVNFTDDALKMIVKVPRPFLKTVLLSCVKWAEDNNCKLITPTEMKIINDNRSKEKSKK